MAKRTWFTLKASSRPPSLADGIDNLANFIYKDVNDVLYRYASVFIWTNATHVFPDKNGVQLATSPQQSLICHEICWG
jgi:hypothetical protein